VYATTFANPSDRRLKANVLSLDARAQHIFSLNGVSFNYKRRQSDGAVSADGAVEANATTHFGFIAQDVEGNFPELVGRASDGMRSVQYSAFVPLIIEGMKGQRAEAAAQRAAVDVLRARVETMARARDDSSTESDRAMRGVFAAAAAQNFVSVKGLTGTGAVTAHLDQLVVSVKGLTGTGAVTARHDLALLRAHSLLRAEDAGAEDAGAGAEEALASVDAAAGAAAEARRRNTAAAKAAAEVAAEVAAAKAQLRAEFRAELDARDARGAAEAAELRQQIADLAAAVAGLQRDRAPHYSEGRH
jgi:hypothetical protein